jgi:hypothetical protein
VEPEPTKGIDDQLVGRAACRSGSRPPRRLLRGEATPDAGNRDHVGDREIGETAPPFLEEEDQLVAGAVV